ncbi:MAG: InlB B-repeat-containing protein [Paludibacteraceae bacterium]|nr:InlB B-repeat-containing protein [Paludibacteraceae bacterium]
MKKTYLLISLCISTLWAFAAGSADLTVDCGDDVQIQATPKTGYHFVEWEEDGNTDNPRTIGPVSGNLSFTAVFAINTYLIDPEDIGDGVEIAGYDKDTPIPYGTTLTLTATPTDNCYEFEQWSDGNTDNPRQYEFEGTVPFTAQYRLKTFTIRVESNIDTQGDVEVTPVNP